MLASLTVTLNDVVPGWYVFITPGAVMAVGIGLAKVLWAMHRAQQTDRESWLGQLGKFDLALRGYDGQGGLLHDVRSLERQFEHLNTVVGRVAAEHLTKERRRDEG